MVYPQCHMLVLVTEKARDSHVFGSNILDPRLVFIDIEGLAGFTR